MSRLRELLNVPKTFEFNGKKYSLAEANIEQRGEFAAWVENNAVEYIYRMQLNDSEGRFQDFVDKALDKHVKSVAAGEFEWGGDTVLKATQTFAGQSYLLYILLKKDNPEVTEEIANVMLENKYKEVAKIIKEAFDDPKLSAELAELKAMIMSSDS
jgi:hypothetical protein